MKEILKVSDVTENQNNFYGKGGDTIKLLQYVSKRYGPITSFTGRFQVEQWRLRVGWPFKPGKLKLLITLSCADFLASKNFRQIVEMFQFLSVKFV